MDDVLLPTLRAATEGGRDEAAIALRTGDQVLTYGALRIAMAGHVERLRQQGTLPGERIATFTQPGLATMVALLAQAAAGYVTVPVDPKLGALELAHIARDANPQLVVAADPAAVSGKLGVATLLAEVRAGTSPVVEHRPLLNEPLLVLYTSGTTGAPKGALISATNVAFDVDALAEVWDWTAEDEVVHALPLFHVHGLVLGLFGTLRRGGALHHLPRFEPGPLAHALRGPRTMLFAVPTMYHRLAESLESDADVLEGLRAARLLVSGSAGLPLRDHQRIAQATGRAVIERYGLTETLIDCAVHARAPRPGYVGPPLPGVELRLVDDTRQVLDVHDDATIGEIAVRGPHVFLGYLNRDDATREVLDRDGWFYTGDLATRAADGALRIVGRRATDLIKCGGFKVGAGEVEAALLEHPAVREAAVLGMPDADLGEAIVAFVVADREQVDGATLADFVARSLSPHKRPRRVELVSALPRNAMGKVQKKLLRATLEADNDGR